MSTNGLRASLARTLHHFVSTSLHQGLCLDKLNHTAMSPSLTSHVSQHQLHIPSGLLASPHARRISLLKAGQRSLRNWALPTFSDSGRGWYPSLKRACGPSRGCHNLPFMAFGKTVLQVLSVASLWWKQPGGSPGFDVRCRKNLSWPGKMKSLLLCVPLI